MNTDIVLTQEEIDIFWSRVIIDPKTGCWIYEGPTDDEGYGRFNINNKRFYAHRVAWTLYKGAIPSGLEVCHSCDNPPCVRYKCFFLGTRKVNATDSVSKGRQDPRDGENNPAARLTWADVAWIRKVYLLEAEFTQANLARLFGVTQATIHNVLINKTWIPK